MGEYLSRDGILPLHQQLREYFSRRILSGQLRPGDPLPSETELQMAFSVSRFTLRQALDSLAREGLVVRHRGRGTFVARPRVVEQPLSGFYSFAQAMVQRGIAHRSVVMELVKVAASDELAERLGIGIGNTVVRVVRLRFAEDEPLVLETSHLPLLAGTPLTAEDLTKSSIYDLLEVKSGIRVTRATENIRPVVLSAEERRLLRTDFEAAFHVERTAYAGEMPVEWRISVVRGDTFSYFIELPRSA